MNLTNNTYNDNNLDSENKNKSIKSPERIIKRSIAYKIPISSIKDGFYINNEGFEPSYVDTIYGEISRVNIIGAVISKSNIDESLDIEDGTGRILVRKSVSGYNNVNLSNIALGEVINIIGKVRSFSNNTYIIPEIITTIKNLKWIEVRKLEIESLKKLKNIDDIKKNYLKNSNQYDIEDVNNSNEIKNKIEYVSDDNYSQIRNETTKTPDFEKMISLIKNLDKGNGVDIDVLLEKTNISNGKEIIQKMLEFGEIFEIRPGKIKILE